MPTDYSLLRKFKNCKELQQKVDVYFNLREKEKRPFTLSGLALSLGVDRVTLLYYNKGEKVSLPADEKQCIVNTLNQAKSRCEEYAEDSLFIGKNPNGAAFALKNNYKGWKDKQEVEVTKPLLILK